MPEDKASQGLGKKFLTVLVHSFSPFTKLPIGSPMELLTKLEDLVNRLLFWIGSKIATLLLKVIPTPVQKFYRNINQHFTAAVSFVRNFPQWVKSQIAALRARPKIQIDYKGLIAQAIDAGTKAFKKTKDKSPLKAIGIAAIAPLLFLVNWARTLKPAHFMVLSVFTVGSLLSLVGISYNARTILKEKYFAGRTPASAEAEVDSYDRPEYYKKTEREVFFNSVKVPVYVEGINELRALMIDVSLITSNRATRIWLLREEFSLRDHLVLTLEPVIPAFPMTPEGRQILTQKIQDELNAYLREHQVNGHVEEVRLIHILAH